MCTYGDYSWSRLDRLDQWLKAAAMAATIPELMQEVEGGIGRERDGQTDAIAAAAAAAA